MTEIQHADTFFFITAVAVVLVGTGMLVALYYLTLILRDVHLMVRKVRYASEALEQDFEDVRSTIRNEGERVRMAFEMGLGFITRQFTKSRPKRKTASEKVSKAAEDTN